MRQRILLFISILMLNCFPVIAEESLPPLPSSPPLPALEMEIASDNAIKEPTLWSKIKKFFGFEDEVQEKNTSSELEIVDDQVETDPLENESAQSNLLSENVAESLSSNTDEGPTTNQSEEILSLSEKAAVTEVPKIVAKEPEISKDLIESNESDEKLELPTGFEDKDADLIADEEKGIDSKDVPVKEENIVDKESAKLDLPSSLSEVDNSKSAIPDYIPSNVVEESDTSISKFQKEIISKQEQPLSIEKISPEELKEKDNLDEFTKVAAADLEKEQLEFVNNESQLLILPNDDVVEGELTEEVTFDLMDFREYVIVFWSKYNWIKNEDKRESIEDFINNVSEDEYVYSEEELVLALSEATKSIERNNIYSLVFLLDAYPILQKTGESGNTLLHEAVYKDNYLSARLLLSKGIDMSVKNRYNHTALELAEKMGNKKIIFLLKSSKL